MNPEREDPAGQDGAEENIDAKSTYENKDSSKEGAAQGSDATDGQEELGPEVLDEAPATIRRPLCIVDKHGYAVAQIWLKTPDGNEYLVLSRGNHSL